MLTTSVIIPTKNRPDLLWRALNSVLKQTVLPDQIIIVNDGERVNLYPLAQEKNNIRVIENNESKGGAEARNIGARHSKGQLLMFLDDDDEWLSKKIEEQVRTVENNTDCGLVYSGRLIRSQRQPKTILRSSCSKRSGYLFPDILVKNEIGITSSVAIKSELFFSVGGFDVQMPCRQDYDLWIRAAKESKVLWDGCFNVYYTTWPQKNQQISKTPENHPIAAAHILRKYKDDIGALKKTKKNQAIAEKWFSVAKAYKAASTRRFLYYLLKSQTRYLAPSRFLFLLPLKILQKKGLA